MAKNAKTTKKTSAKPAPKKAPAKPPKPAGAKKPAAKTSAKPAAAPAKAAKPVKKDVKAAPAKPAPKPAPKAASAASSKPAAAPAKSDAKAAPAPAGGASGRKGITIVNQKPQKKSSAKGSITRIPSPGGNLLGPGSPMRKPLIPSGPTAEKPMSLGDGADLAGKKSPFNKRELARFRAILLAKRSELIGDVNNMEREALQGNAGSLSNLPQHMADQGSDAYDQSLALDLAAAERRQIKEIDDALQRIENGTYGLCELTGKPIRPERLEEIPWARHSIEAARELERRSPRP